MAVAVSVVPPALVPVLDGRREEPIQRLRDVFLHESRFELVGDNRTRRRWSEDAGEAVADTRSFNRFRNAVRDVDRLNPSAGLEWNRLPVGDHGAGISWPSKKVRGARWSQPCLRLPSVGPLLLPGKEEVARAAPRLVAEIARSPRGWALVGGRIVERLSGAR